MVIYMYNAPGWGKMSPMGSNFFSESLITGCFLHPDIKRFCLTFYIGCSPQFLEYFSVNFARSAKTENKSIQSGEQSDFSH